MSIEGADVPVLKDTEHGPNVEACGTSHYEPDPDDEEDGIFLSWNIERLAYDEKRGEAVTII